MLELIKAPEGPWQIIGVDLITQLPLLEGYNSILTVVDYFTK